MTRSHSLPTRALLIALSPLLLAAGACKSDKPLGPAPGCTISDAQTLPNLNRFQGTVVALDEGKTCAAALLGDARYLIVPQFAIAYNEPDKTTFLIGPGSPTTTTAATSASLTAAAAQRTASGTSVATVDEGSIPRRQRAFDGLLRTRERALVPAAQAERAARGGRSAPVARASTAAAAQPATSRTFKVLGNLDGTSVKSSTGTLRYAGTNVLVYVDVNTPTGFTETQIQNFGRLFDETLYPVTVGAFGPPSDIDQNARIVVLMTPLINALTTKADCEENNEFVTGYFYGVDLLTTQANSNKAEVFYSMVPDPQAQFSCAQPVFNVSQYVPATFVHELQHMISFGQHVGVFGGQDEDTWLNEGLSHIAEEIAANHYLSRGRPDSAAPFNRGNLNNARAYLSKITDYSVTTYSDFGALEERGATWLFLRWLADQKEPTLGGTTVFRALVQTKRTGVANVEAVAQETFGQLFGSFGIALYTDSIPGVPRTSIPDRFRFKTRNLRRDLAPYPVFADPADAQPPGATNSMVQGTMKHYQITTATGARTPVRFSRPDLRAFNYDLGPQVGIFRLQ